jgi:phosphotriesterase-related protein
MKNIGDQVRDFAGKVMTVNGLISPEALGITLMHEHLFVELWLDKVPGPNASLADADLWEEKLGLENLHLARKYKYMRDTYILSGEDSAISEVSEFKSRGGSTIVDVTNLGLGRDPTALSKVSMATGLNIIMGCGWYQKAYHPADMDARTVDDLTEEMIRDITVGVGDTGIRAGIIGEVGINGEPLTPNEIKNLRASARASRATGAAITLHRGGIGAEKLQTMAILEAEGADLSRVIFGHSDGIAWDMPLMLEILSRGVYIQFDMLGMDNNSLFLRPRSRSIWDLTGLAQTPQVIEALPKLIEKGYEDRILLSQDVYTKMQLKRYGGNGYSFIIESVLPELLKRGITDDQIHSINVENPARILTFVEPR